MTTQQVSSLIVLTFLLLVQCMSSVHGHDNRGRVKRTIGGERIRLGAWPWLALLKATIVTERLFGVIPLNHYHLYCGGVLISDRWILSAAHCFTENGQGTGSPGNWEARLATVRLRADFRQRVLDIIGRVINQSAFRNWEIDIDRIVIYPTYNTTGLYSDDIALVRLSRSVPSSLYRRQVVRNVTLPTQVNSDFPTPGQVCITKGWGCTANGGRASTVAHQIEMPIYPKARCQNHYNLGTMNHRICAGYRNRNMGVCKGDSGSPLVCLRGDNYVLAGIVSFTSRHHPESFPAVFTEVKSYLPWIQSVTGINLQ